MTDISDQSAQLALVEGLLLTMSDRKAPRTAVRRATAAGVALLEGKGSVKADASDHRYAEVKAGLEARRDELRESTLTRPPVESNGHAPARRSSARVLRATESGKSSDQVRALQERLLGFGYDVGGKGADGVFGVATKRGVRRFQRDHGLRVDGVVGRHTTRMMDAVAESAASGPAAMVTGHGMGRGRVGGHAGAGAPADTGDKKKKKKTDDKAKPTTVAQVNTAAAASRGGAAISEAANQPRSRGGKKQKPPQQQQGAGGPFDPSKHPRAPKGRTGGGQFTASQQGYLAQLGYNPGPQDGIAGPKTEAAVRKYQSDHGLPVTGQLDAATSGALSSAFAPPPSPSTSTSSTSSTSKKSTASASKSSASTAKKSGGAGDANTGISSTIKPGAGMSGKPDGNVRSLQKVLDVLGYDLGRPGTDGRYGPITRRAVIRFQEQFGLAPDGIIGHKTRRALTRAAKRDVRNQVLGIAEAIRSEADLREALEAFATAADRGRERRRILTAAAALDLTHILPDTWRTPVQEAASKSDAQRSAQLDASVEKLVKRLIARGMPEAVAKRAARKRLTAKHGQTDASAKARADKLTEAEVKAAVDVILAAPLQLSEEELTEALADGATEFGGELSLSEAKDSMRKASTPEPFSRSKTSNWVARMGGLPAYIQHIAHDLVEKRGKSESNAIQMAIGIVKRWARGGGKVDANTRAAAAKAVAQWEAMKAGAKAKRAVKAAAEVVYRADDQSSLVESAPTPMDLRRAQARERVAWGHVDQLDERDIEEAFGLGLLRGEAFNSRVSRNRLGKFIDIAPGSGSMPDKLRTTARRVRAADQARVSRIRQQANMEEMSSEVASELANRLGRQRGMASPPTEGLPGVPDGRSGRPDEIRQRNLRTLDLTAPVIKTLSTSALQHHREQAQGYMRRGIAGPRKFAQQQLGKARRVAGHIDREMARRGRPAAPATNGLAGVPSGGRTESVPRFSSGRVPSPEVTIPGLADGSGGKPDSLPRNRADLGTRTARRGRPTPPSTTGVNTGISGGGKPDSLPGATRSTAFDPKAWDTGSVQDFSRLSTGRLFARNSSVYEKVGPHHGRGVHGKDKGKLVAHSGRVVPLRKRKR